MFTGIIEEAGVVEAVRPTAKSIALTVRTRGIARGLLADDEWHQTTVFTNT